MLSVLELFFHNHGIIWRVSIILSNKNNDGDALTLFRGNWIFQKNYFPVENVAIIVDLNTILKVSCYPVADSTWKRCTDPLFFSSDPISYIWMSADINIKLWYQSPILLLSLLLLCVRLYDAETALQFCVGLCWHGFTWSQSQSSFVSLSGLVLFEEWFRVWYWNISY